tara:strand:- start:4217 stop:6142 length:1926 start_codon:yes stop_codon:yes gene_type:complete
MSLVITSNVALDDRPDTSEVFKPYSYQNPLLNTMRIPANSEIALQSAKINKNGVASLTAANSNFNHYFGVPVGTALCPKIENSTQIPFPAIIGAGLVFREGGRAERNIDDLTLDISSGINAAAYNPSLINAVVPTSIVVTQNRTSAANKALEGFNFTATQEKTIVKKGKATAVWSDISVNSRAGFTQTNGVVTSTTTTGFHVQAKQYPIAQAKGSVFFDISSLNGDDVDKKPWVVGLSRINRRIANNTGVSRELPEYFNTTAQKAGSKLPRVGGQVIYGDIMVGRSGTDLCVWQSGVDSNAKLGGTKMNEIIYYGGDFNPQFKAGKYNLKNNDDDYVKVKFTLDNENMKIELIDDSDTVVLLADFTVAKSKGGVKENLTAPICAPKMAMYPIMAGRTIGTTGSLDELFHYTNYPTWDEATYTNYDWWGYSQKNNLTRWCLEVESRFWNDFGDTSSGILKDGLQIPVLSAVGGELVGYQSMIITAPSLEYGLSKTFSQPSALGAGITGNATASRLMGFLNTPVSIPKSNTAGVTITNSVSVPILSTDASIFVRLNNFTQKTVNARQGTGSKIIAHLPRFDNSGNDLGGLYFSPNFPTYLSLGNTEDLLINSFDIDIVYDNETLCTALSGKTVVCLHIRDKVK